MQNVGDIFDLTKNQAEYYEKLGWVQILPEELQPKHGRGRKKVLHKSAIDLSKSSLNGRFLEHNFSQKK